MDKSSYGTGIILRNQNDEKLNGVRSREGDEPDPCVSANDDGEFEMKIKSSNDKCLLIFYRYKE